MKTKDHTSIKEYYNNYDKKLLVDYMKANPRIEVAIIDALKLLDFSNKKILDIGCGIGWSSHEFSKIAKSVHGVDISPVLTDLARRLFDRSNLEYSTIDITKNQQGLNSNYDIVTLIDVFEHIPSSERLKFYKSINSLLKPSGFVYLTCPSKYHQSWLRHNKPEGLQPVDEDVDISTLNEFCLHLDGSDVIYFKYFSIWESNDYFHAILQKAPVSCRLNNQKSHLESMRNRIRRVKIINEHHQLFSRKEIDILAKDAWKIQYNKFKKRIKKFLF